MKIRTDKGQMTQEADKFYARMASRIYEAWEWRRDEEQDFSVDDMALLTMMALNKVHAEQSFLNAQQD